VHGADLLQRRNDLFLVLLVFLSIQQLGQVLAVGIVVLLLLALMTNETSYFFGDVLRELFVRMMLDV